MGDGGTGGDAETTPTSDVATRVERAALPTSEAITVVEDAPSHLGAGAHTSRTGPSAIPTGATTSRTAATSTTRAESPELVLRRLEIEQTRNVSVTALVFNAVALAVGPFLGGDPFARRVFMAAAGFALLNNAYRFFIANDRRYREAHLLVFIALSAVTNTGIAYYLGVFGPIAVIFVIDQYNASLYYGPRVTVATLIASTVPVIFLGTTFGLGVLPDPGLVSTVATGPALRGVVIGVFVLLMVVIAAQTARTRQVTESSLEELDQLVRLAARREALFLEARQELDRALRAGGLGRFSDQVLGSYRLGAVIGRGGMGEVYEATHVTTGEPAAVKMLLPEILSRAELVRRFLREVRIAASLDSPNVVRVLEVGDERAALPYLAMELLRGESLAQILRRERQLDAAAITDLAAQVARGIEAAGDAGIVHRDIKPQNVFLTEGGTYKVLDFGISKLADGGTLTHGEVMGTPQYMAPEQVDGEVDHRTDVYGLAAVIYRALTGRQPFVGSDFGAVVIDLATKMPIRPTDLAPDAHRHIDHALALGLAKRPDDRFATATELADAVAAALRGGLSRALRARAREVEARSPWRREVPELV